MKKASPTLIGVFVLGALALALGGLAVFGSGKFLQRKTEVIMYFEGSVNGLSVGAPVKFKGVPIGQVSAIRLIINEKEDIVAIPVIAEIDESKLSDSLGIRVELTPERIDELIKVGMRATLESQSLVTGLLFVGLDLHPDTEATKLPIKSALPQIPTLPSTLEQFSETLSEVLKQIQEVDLRKLMDGISQTIAGIERLVNSPVVEETLNDLDATLKALRKTVEEISAAIGPVAQNLEEATKEASSVLSELRETVNNTNEMLQPDAPLLYQLERTIKDVGKAARALQQLAELVDEQPSVLLYGRESGEKR